MNTDGKEERNRVGQLKNPNIITRLTITGEPFLCAVGKTQLPFLFEFSESYESVHIPCEATLFYELDMNLRP